MFDWRPREERGQLHADAVVQLQPLGSMTLAAQKLNQMDAVHVRSLASSAAPKIAVPKPRPSRPRLHKLHNSMYPRVKLHVAAPIIAYLPPA